MNHISYDVAIHVNPNSMGESYFQHFHQLPSWMNFKDEDWRKQKAASLKATECHESKPQVRMDVQKQVTWNPKLD